MHQVEIVHAEVGGKVMRSGCGPNLKAQPASSMVNQRTAQDGRAEEGVLPCARGSGQNFMEGGVHSFGGSSLAPFRGLDVSCATRAVYASCAHASWVAV